MIRAGQTNHQSGLLTEVNMNNITAVSWEESKREDYNTLMYDITHIKHERDISI